MTKRKNPEDLLKVGRPTKYKPEYCQRLIEHSKQGGSFDSFGAVIGIPRQTMYQWLKVQPEFRDARKEAQDYLLKFYEDLGKMLATGQMRRLKSEEPVLDSNGKPVLDPRTGEVLMRREYEATQGNATAWIFLTKNMLGWRDKRDIVVAGDELGGPVRLRADDLTPEERMREIAEMTRALAEIEGNNGLPDAGT